MSVGPFDYISQKDDFRPQTSVASGGAGPDADTLDALDSSQFLRSDASDTYSAGTLTIAAAAALAILGTLTLTSATSIALPTAAGIITGAGAGSDLDADLLDGQHGSYYQARANHTGTQAPATISPQGSGSSLDADLLDGVEGASFLRSDTNDNFTSGTLTFDASTTLHIEAATVNAGTIGGSGNLVLDPTGNNVNPGSSTIPDISLGQESSPWLALHASELRVGTLVSSNEIATTGGRFYVGTSTDLTRDLASGGTTMYVRHNNLENTDFCILRAGGEFEAIKVTSTSTAEGAGDYSYTITRNLDGSGANNWDTGDTVFGIGKAVDEGFLELYAESSLGGGTGPAVAAMVRDGTALYSDVEPRALMGNLNGFYGYAAAAWGFAAGDPDVANIVIDSTNGIRIRNGTAVRGQWDTSGVAFFGNQAAFHMKVDPGADEIRILEGASDRFTFTPGILSISGSPGEIVAAQGTLGDLEVNASQTATGDAVFRGDVNANLLFVDASTERIGILEAAPSLPLHISVDGGTTAGPPTWTTTLDAMVIEADEGDNVVLQILNNTSTVGLLAFSDTAARNRGYVKYDHSADEMGFGITGTDKVTFKNGIRVGNPTGGDKGNGTINVAGDVYKANSAYTNPDYVLEHWATGEIKQFADRPGAADYPGLMPLDQVEAFIRENHHLPRVPRGPAGMFERGDIALEKIEELTLHILALEKRVRTLEAACGAAGGN